LRDVRFAASDGARYSAVDVIRSAVPLNLVKCWIIFRTQKNGQHGEEKLFTKNPDPAGRCFVSAMLRIIHRFARLRGVADLQTPLAVYRPSPVAAPLLVTSLDIEKVMRDSACRVYKLDPVKDKAALSRWSAHSLRVGACTLLHAMGVTETQIKWLLRWRSDAFMVYLRSTTILANRHFQVMDLAAAMPNFL
jgi:hypothetical protein